MSKSKSFIAGLLCGGAIAGLTALLAAPSSGNELRRKLKQQAAQWKQALDEITNDSTVLKSQIVQTAAEGKEVFVELKDDIQKSFSTWKQGIELNTENIEREIEEIQQSIESLQKTIPIKK